VLKGVYRFLFRVKVHVLVTQRDPYLISAIVTHQTFFLEHAIELRYYIGIQKTWDVLCFQSVLFVLAVITRATQIDGMTDLLGGLRTRGQTQQYG
jgi:hypothetical protein